MLLRGISSTSSLKNTVVHNRYNERKGMNMCTVQSIKDAIRENCQSQYDMESTDIDRVLQTLPFSQEPGPFSKPKSQRPLYWFHARKHEKV